MAKTTLREFRAFQLRVLAKKMGVLVLSVNNGKNEILRTPDQAAEMVKEGVRFKIEFDGRGK